MSTKQQWSEEYQRLLDNPPASGTIIRAQGEESARLDLELHEGKPPFVYGRAYIPSIFGEALGWFLQPMSAENAYGWKCILLPKAREELLRKRGVRDARIAVKSLKVVRHSKSGQALLCEVHELD